MKIEMEFDHCTRKGTVTTTLGEGLVEVLHIKGLNIAEKRSMIYDTAEDGSVSNIRRSDPTVLELTMVEDEDADHGDEGTTEAAD